MSLHTPARAFFPGMGVAVADRTVTRRKDDGTRESWADVAHRVALGNALLDPRKPRFGAATLDFGTAELNEHQAAEYHRMNHHLRQASLLMSGRHLQHGDETQPTRPQEVYTNCLDFSTRILTMEYGPIEIGKIVDQTVTVIAGDGELRPAQINAHGEQDLYEITFRANSGGGGNFRHTVKATANHRWFLRDGSITDALKVGDVLKATRAVENLDPQAIIHGLVFGDGTAHKSRRDAGRPGVSQGRTYASIRVCKSDTVAREIHEYLDEAGYRYTTPPHANGDRVYYVGKFEYAKELPFSNDPSYVAGFIYGWWLADGSKGVNHALEISTADEVAANWLSEHAAYAGYSVTMSRVLERNETDGSFANGKALRTIRLRRDVEWKVESIEPLGRGLVYCPEEPVTSSFVLANGLLTGNCSTSATTFLLFYLLLNGSGVGRAYDDAMIVADLNQMPIVVPVIDWGHKDVVSGEIKGFLTERDARHLYADRECIIYKVPDSREGWAKAIELIETMAFERKRDAVLLLDFSDVRPRGAPIRGMQGRPASGPGPLMNAITSIAKLRDAGMAPWRAAIYADHYAAECVLVGGARRAARMATKRWDDATIFDFIQLKRGGFLWSSNNSVTIDEEFRAACRKIQPLVARMENWGLDNLWSMIHFGRITEREAHAWRVLIELARAAYFDGTGEPGLINQDKLARNDAGIGAYLDGLYAESARYKVSAAAVPLMKKLAERCLDASYSMITNPCGEIALLMLGAYCVIADVVPFHAQNDDDAEDAFRTAVRALMRTNLMDCLYRREVNRTNRIGVGITGFHEWAKARFGFGWKELVDEKKSRELWLTLSRFKRAVAAEAAAFADVLGVSVPHTNTTFKPAGTTSKLFGLTEGAHLPSMRFFLRWVQFRYDDPLVKEYAAKGYPTRELKSYSGTVIVGFPTAPAITELGENADWIVTAAEATPEEQYEFLRLLEKYWLTGVHEDGVTPLVESGNQISYTLKYDPSRVDFDHFLETLIDGQFSIRACSVMPQSDTSAYEYLPEEPIARAEYDRLVARITDAVKEDVDFSHVDCGAGACPIDFREDEEAA